MLKLNLILFLSSCAILFFVLRYRVHLHLEYRPRIRRVSRRRSTTGPGEQVAGVKTPGEGSVSPAILKDLESALVNLGASKDESRAMAEAAAHSGLKNFDALLLKALEYRPAIGGRNWRNPR